MYQMNYPRWYCETITEIMCVVTTTLTAEISLVSTTTKTTPSTTTTTTTTTTATEPYFACGDSWALSMTHI